MPTVIAHHDVKDKDLGLPPRSAKRSSDRSASPTVAKKHPRKLAVHALRWIVEGVGNGSALFVPAPLSRLDVKGDRPLAFVTALLTHASVSSPLHAVTPLAVAHLR